MNFVSAEFSNFSKCVSSSLQILMKGDIDMPKNITFGWHIVRTTAISIWSVLLITGEIFVKISVYCLPVLGLLLLLFKFIFTIKSYHLYGMCFPYVIRRIWTMPISWSHWLWMRKCVYFRLSYFSPYVYMVNFTIFLIDVLPILCYWYTYV